MHCTFVAELARVYKSKINLAAAKVYEWRKAAGKMFN